MLSVNQVVVGASSVPLCTVPSGPCLVVITNDSASAASAYIGVTPVHGTLAATNGIPLPAGQSLVFPGYKMSTGASLSAISTGTATVGWLISNDG
jgi:hypothetical protein